MTGNIYVVNNNHFFFLGSSSMWKTQCTVRYISIVLLLLLLLNIWLSLRQLNNRCLEDNIYDLEFLARSQHSINENNLPKTVGDPPKYNVKNYEASEPTEMGFNISFDLGRWDKGRLYKIYDFVSVGKNFVSLSKKFSVCMASQSSIEKLYSLVQASQQWAGPISTALYAAGDDEYFLIHWYVRFLQKCFPWVDLKVSFHLAVPKFKIPTGKYPDRLKNFGDKNYKCNQYRKVHENIVNLRSPETVKWRTKDPYPQNHLRNLARKNCQSENVFLTDIDIIPSSNLAENLDVFLKSSKRKCPMKCAYVIPTYELDERTNFPKNKNDLIRLSHKGLARAFHQKVFIYNQYATNFSRWENFPDTSDNEVIISHDVTNFEFLYEPFYVAPDTVPEHDERFLGYGYTRNTQVYEMFVSGYKFQVLTPVFTIHWGLQDRKSRPHWRERQNSNNRRKFEVFKKEVSAKYINDPLKMNKN